MSGFGGGGGGRRMDVCFWAGGGGAEWLGWGRGVWVRGWVSG